MERDTLYNWAQPIIFSSVDCFQLGRLILEPEDGVPLTFESSLRIIGDRMQFEVGNRDAEVHYRVTVKVEEI